jgi:copper chaperone CopZ
MATALKLDRPQDFFHVKDMTSERAAEAVLSALKNLDVGATVRIDLSLRRVEIDSETAEPAALREAISKVGYSSVRQWPSDCAYLWA